MRYEVTIKETVYYGITVEAKSEKKARKKALADHEDGLSSETDSSAGKIDSIEEVSNA